MDDAARIRALRDQGRIDDAQAERLLAALGTPDGGTAPDAAGPRSGVGGDAAPGAAVVDPPPDPARPGSRGRTATHGEGGGVRTSARPPGDAAADAVVRRWARVDMFAGTLRVTVDPGLDAPVARADDDAIDVTRDGEGWRIAQRPREGGPIERLLDGFRRVDVRVRLPDDTGLDLDAKAGDVKLADVPALRGRLLAGDLEAAGLRAVDVALEAGDLDVSLDPAPGDHRVRMTVGDAEVRLPADADVVVDGRVKVGDAEGPAPLRTKNGGVSGRLEGTLGAGTARLSLEVVSGDLDVVVA